MTRIFNKNKSVRLSIFFLSILIILFSCVFATYYYFEGHAIHVLDRYESEVGTLMVVGKSDGVFSGWKMQLYFEKKNEPWVVYSLNLEANCWKAVTIKESNGHAYVFVSDHLAANLDLHSLLLENDFQHQIGTCPIYLIQDENPFNKSAIVKPGDVGWPSKWPMPSPIH